MRTDVLSLLVMGLLGGCKVSDALPTVDRDAGEDAAVAPEVEGTSFSSLERIAGLGAGPLTAVAALEDKVFVGTERGLFLGRAPNYTLVRVAHTVFEGQFVSSLATFRGSIFASTRNHSTGIFGAVLRSSDGGSTWEVATPTLDVPESGVFSGAELAASDNRLVVAHDRVEGRGLSEWNEQTRSWTPMSMMFHDDTFDVDAPITPQSVSFEADALVVDGFTWCTGSGRYAQQAGSEKWSQLAASEVSDSSLIVDTFARDGVVLSAQTDALRRSTDGVTWTEIVSSPTFLPNAFAATETTLFWISDRLRSSSDLGQTWTEHETDLASPQEIHVSNATVVARTYAQWTSTMASKPFAMAAPGESFAARTVSPEFLSVAFTGTDLWTYDSSIENFAYGAPGDEILTATRSPDEINDAQVHTTVNDIFVSSYLYNSRGEYSNRCVRSTEYENLSLRRYDIESAAWVDASEGLPTWRDCRDFDGFLYISAMNEANGVLFATVNTRAVFRSEDRGATWEQIEDGAPISLAVACGDSIVARMSDGSFARSIDAGLSFDSVEIGIDHISDLVSIGDACVLSTAVPAGSPSLYISHDGFSLAPLFSDFREPVVALAADATTLAIATEDSGVFRTTILAPRLN